MRIFLLNQNMHIAKQIIWRKKLEYYEYTMGKKWMLHEQ